MPIQFLRDRHVVGINDSDDVVRPRDRDVLAVDYDDGE